MATLFRPQIIADVRKEKTVIRLVSEIMRQMKYKNLT